MMTLDRLPSSLHPVEAHLRRLARSWIDDGADGCRLRCGDDVVVIEGSCDEHRLVSAPFGGLLSDCVWEVGTDQRNHARVEAEAELLGELAARNEEVGQLAGALLESGEQLLAIYDLTRSSLSRTTGSDRRRIAVADALRLTGAACVALVGVDDTLHVGDDTVASRMLPWNRDATRSAMCRIEGVGDVAVRPLPHRPDGTLLVASGPDQRFTTGDHKLIDAISLIVGGLIALERMSREAVRGAVIERDAETAAKLARMLLPRERPDVEGLDVAGRCDPARLAGGDFYLWIPSGDHLVVAVGDVSGKGLGAALVMTMVVRTTTRLVLEAKDPDPHGLFRSLATQLTDYLSEAGVFITMAIGVYRRDGDTIRLANAGHSPVLVGNADGFANLPPTAPPLGVMEDMVADTVELPFVAGDVVVMGTDGLVEQEDGAGAQLGDEWIADHVSELIARPAATIVDSLFSVVERHAGETAASDDRTAVIIRRREAPCTN